MREFLDSKAGILYSALSKMRIVLLIVQSYVKTSGFTRIKEKFL